MSTQAPARAVALRQAWVPSGASLCCGSQALASGGDHGGEGWCPQGWQGRDLHDLPREGVSAARPPQISDAAQILRFVEPSPSCFAASTVQGEPRFPVLRRMAPSRHRIRLAALAHRSLSAASSTRDGFASRCKGPTRCLALMRRFCTRFIALIVDCRTVRK